MTDLAEQIERHTFLGSEFLLWLWFEGERSGGRFHLEGEWVELQFDDQLDLHGLLASAEESRMRGGAPTASPEAHKALQLGKRVGRARLKLTRGEREWTFVVRSQDFLLAGMRLPAVLSEGDDEKLSERLYLIEELENTWHGVYRLFLQRRTGKGWKKLRGELAAWIASPVEGDAAAR